MKIKTCESKDLLGQLKDNREYNDKTIFLNKEFDNIILNVHGGYDLKLYEVDEIVAKIKVECREDINLIFAWTIDSSLNTHVLLKMLTYKGSI